MLCPIRQRFCRRTCCNRWTCWTGYKFKRWFLDCPKPKSRCCHSRSSSTLSTNAPSTTSFTTSATTTGSSISSISTSSTPAIGTGFEFLVDFHFFHYQFQSDQNVTPYAIAGIPNTVPNGQSVITDHFQPIRPVLPIPPVAEAPPAKTELPKPEPTSPGNLFSLFRLVQYLSF